jgi:GntR family transcriptional regulator/MocR family aminotransferase
MDNSRHPSKRVSLAGMHIDRNSAVPLHLQIAAHIRDGILRGVFPAGTQFLGSREIARELGCSRTVVLTAWDLLYAEGYLASMPRGSVMVASVATPHAAPSSATSRPHVGALALAACLRLRDQLAVGIQPGRA